MTLRSNGPPNSPRDIAAKTADPQNPGDEKTLLRALFAERFAMKSHREAREGIVYSLGIGKNASKLTAHDEGTGTSTRTTCGHMIGKRVTTDVLATCYRGTSNTMYPTTPAYRGNTISSSIGRPTPDPARIRHRISLHSLRRFRSNWV